MFYTQCLTEMKREIMLFCLLVITRQTSWLHILNRTTVRMSYGDPLNNANINESVMIYMISIKISQLD